MITKPLRQFGEHGNDYSVLELGDKVNEIIDYMNNKLPTTPLVETKEKVEEKLPIIINNIAVRSQSTADKVYLIKDGKKHWIKNPETLTKLGFNFHTVKNITNEEMAKYETAEPINLKEPKVLEVQEPKDDANQYKL